MTSNGPIPGSTQLYLHCGWPRTGTTSLQAFLAESREPLAAAGIDYPARWQRKGRDNHNGLVDLLSSEDDGSHSPGASVRAFQDYARTRANQAMVLSCEELIFWRVTKGGRAPLLDLLASFRQVGALSCIATLRRVDDLFSSIYLHHMLGQGPLASPDQYFQRCRNLMGPLFAGMQDLADSADELTYAHYRPSGSHQEEILELLGIPADLRVRMSAGPRLNARLTSKTVAVLLNIETISARAGVPIDSDSVRKLHWAGRLKFDGDMPCELLGADLRRSLHEEALDLAREVGLTAYGEFFAADEILAPAPTSPDPEILSAGDLDHLVCELTSWDPTDD